MSKFGIEENELIIEEFLETIKSVIFTNCMKSSLKNFFGTEVVNHGWEWRWEKNLFEIKPSDLNHYNKYVNRYAEWSFKTKITKFGHIKRLVKFLLKHYEDEFNERIYDRLRADLNEKDYYEWDEPYEHKQPETAYKRYFMPIDQINQILEHLCDDKPVFYLMFRLLTESGLRKGELISINLERNVEGEIVPIEQDLNSRMIRVKGKKGLLKYPITEELKNQLLNYLKENRYNYEVEDEKGKPLFITPCSNRVGDGALNTLLMGTKYHKDIEIVYISGEKKQIKKGEKRRKGILSKLGITDHITPQTFRRSLNELRALKGCPDKWLAILLNHKIQSDSEKSGTNIQYYQNRNFPKVLEAFDKYYPYGELFSDLNYY